MGSIDAALDRGVVLDEGPQQIEQDMVLFGSPAMTHGANLAVRSAGADPLDGIWGNIGVVGMPTMDQRGPGTSLVPSLAATSTLPLAGFAQTTCWPAMLHRQ